MRPYHTPAKKQGLTRLGHILVWQLAILGMTMLGPDLIGLFTSLRSADLATAKTAFGPEDLTLSSQEVQSLATRREGEPILELVKRANTAVNKGMAHYWAPAVYNFHVPVTENWALWLFGLLDARFQQWEFMDYHKALDRGVGLCSQHAIVLNGLLREQGVRSQIVSLGDLHVVNRVEVAAGEWVIADPDLGVILPDLPAITPELIRATYRTVALGSSAVPETGQPDPTDAYVAAYQAPLRFSDSPNEYNSGASIIEDLACKLKWWAPLFLIVAAAALVLQSMFQPLGYRG